MLKVHFLNVGKGNCTIIEFPERLAMVDIDNSRVDDGDSKTDPIDYYRKNFSNKQLWRFILTHPDMDHMSGLDEFSKNVPIVCFWDTEHNKQMGDDWNSCPYNKEDWDKYQEFRNSKEKPQCLHIYQNQTNNYWTQDNITILSPTQNLVELAKKTEEYNHLSYVLRFEYKGVVFLLGGDATKDAWDEIYSTCDASDLQADIFLAPHHGSEKNVNEKVFKNINPDYVIVSVAEGVDYDYDYYSRLANKKVLSTKHYGTMIVEVSHTGEYEINKEGS
jgi:beta-lactamase superfamily II metal-dependent hydrolase